MSGLFLFREETMNMLTQFRFHITLDEVKIILQRTYPEVAHATVRETTLEDGSICHHFIARAGRKG